MPGIEKPTRKRYFVKLMQEDPQKRKCPARKWTKRVGLIATLFFLAKGLVWLGIAAVGAYYTFN